MNQQQMAANDQSLADATQAAAKTASKIQQALDALHSYVGDSSKTVYHGRRSSRVWSMTDAEAEQAARDDQGPTYYVSNRAEYLVALDAAREFLAFCKAEAAKYEQVWRDNGRWSRFFIVQEGHIHSSMNCSTCNNGLYPTEFGWLPQLSGMTEADAVALHGAILCTVCFPSAPVEWTNAYELAAAAKQAAQCPGSGKGYDPTAPHEVRRMSKWGKCTGCGTNQTVTPTGKIRAHKAATS